MARKLIAAFVTALVVFVSGCDRTQQTPNPDQIFSGDERALAAAVRSEPRTFNRLAARDSASNLVAVLTQGSLVRVDKITDEVEPWIAESWSRSDDGLSFEFRLRPDLRFSDGEPATADDVVFSFEALYDDSVTGPLADALRVNGEELVVVAVSDQVVRVTYPSPFGPALRSLSSVPVLPKHRLESALEEGTLDSAWGVTTPPEEVVGLGPFRLSAYEPGQRLVFVRNPYYWRSGPDGESLPNLDRLTLEIIPSQDAEVLGLQAGTLDLMQDQIRAEDYSALTRASNEGEVTLTDIGVALDADFLFFNLRSEAMAGDARQPWLQADDFRRAVAHAVDRESFANTVYLGMGVPVHGPVNQANRRWHNPDVRVYGYDPTESRRRLSLLGLEDRDSDGYLEDSAGEPVRFTLLVQSGHSIRERAAAVIAADLGAVGIRVDVRPVEFGALVDSVTAMRFDAAYLGYLSSGTDPAENLDLWMSRSGAHFWNHSQPAPATAWEAQIDDKMREQMAASEDAVRQRLFNEVQEIFAEYIPAIYFAAPRVIVATAPHVTNARPALLRPYILWESDTLGTSDAGRR